MTTSNVVQDMKHYDHYCGRCRTFDHAIQDCPVRIGAKVICNGYPGTIQEVHIGQLMGAVTVRLERGLVCVPFGKPDCFFQELNDSGHRK